MKQTQFFVLIVSIVLYFTTAGLGQRLGSSLPKEQLEKMPITKVEKTEIIDALKNNIEQNYILKNEVSKITSQLDINLIQGTYDRDENIQAFLSALTSDLREITNDAHFNLWYNPDMYSMMERMASSRSATSGNGGGRVRRGGGSQGGQGGGWPDGREKNYFFKELEILDGNVGYLKLEKIPTLENSKQTVDAAMAFLGNTDAVILDLRNNPGGFAGFISYFMSYFFTDGERKHLFTRETSMSPEPNDYYTEETLPSPRLDDIPLYILINDRTGSAATNMTYNLQQHGRAVVVGATTEKGIMGAHSAMPFPLKSNLVVTIPIGRIVHAKTKSNWNNTGVVPEIETTEDAKKIAHEVAIKTISTQ